ncbi:hypothetical protein [uncultured Friedmanniella sp.]|uniref:hypothetical protein n=1 Tax=uncultured Friedmanniella sp. TaxID=335381 RepID=UPI0035CB954E
MRLKLATGPWWVQGLVYGLFFGTAMTIFYGLRDDGSWVFAVVGGAVSGVLFGLLMGVTMSRINRRMLAGFDELTAAEARTVAKASSRGPAPADPRLREAVKALVQRRRSEALRTRLRSVVTFALGSALYVVLAVTRTWWWWLAAALFLGFLMLTLITPARLEKRLAALNADEVSVVEPGTTGHAQPGADASQI